MKFVTKPRVCISSFGILIFKFSIEQIDEKNINCVVTVYNINEC